LPVSLDGSLAAPGLFRLSEAGRYGRPEVYGPGCELKVGIFEDLSMDLELVFGG
jgi:hypothetical protein